MLRGREWMAGRKKSSPADRPDSNSLHGVRATGRALTIVKPCAQKFVLQRATVPHPADSRLGQPLLRRNGFDQRLDGRGDRDHHAGAAIACLRAARRSAAEMGLYASILPLVAYAIFGTSRVLAVGPVAVVSLMTAASRRQSGTAGHCRICRLPPSRSPFLSGLMLSADGGRSSWGFLPTFLSHPVIAGFITASGILIAVSQLKHLFWCIPASGQNLVEIGNRVDRSTCRSINGPTAGDRRCGDTVPVLGRAPA